MVRVEFQIKHNNHQIVITSGHIIPFICILCNWIELPTYSEGRIQVWNTEKRAYYSLEIYGQFKNWLSLSESNGYIIRFKKKVSLLICLSPSLDLTPTGHHYWTCLLRKVPTCSLFSPAVPLYMEYVKQVICDILKLMFSCLFIAREKRLHEGTKWMELLGKEWHQHIVKI